jgi:hypothetical protein
MRNSRAFVLALAALAVTVGLLTVAAAAPVPPEKRCYNSAGEEIPCPNSNYLQTQYAARATSRVSGPTYTPVPPTWTPTPTTSPTATSTIAPAATQAPTSGALPAQPAQPAGASAPLATAPRPSTIQILIPIIMLVLAGVIGLVVLVLIIRWLSSRRSAPPG